MEKLLVSALFIAACGGAASSNVKSEGVATTPGELKADDTSTNYLSTNCEIFVDKVEPIMGEHGSTSLNLYIKTLNDRLDGNLIEVGYRDKVTVQSAQLTDYLSHDWTNTVLQKFEGATNYFSYNAQLDNIYMTGVVDTGAFYAKTDHDVYYWLKPGNNDSQNFVLDENGYKNAYALLPPDSVINDADPNQALPTQTSALSYYNVDACR